MRMKKRIWKQARDHQNRFEGSLYHRSEIQTIDHNLLYFDCQLWNDSETVIRHNFGDAEKASDFLEGNTKRVSDTSANIMRATIKTFHSP